MQIITIANQKGGVGKTTTAVNLAASLAASEYNTLLIDLDPQTNASSSLNITNSSESQKNIYELLIQCIQNETISFEPTTSMIDRLHVVPGTIDLAAVESEFSELDNPQMLLSKLLNKVKLDCNYDFLIIDTPPGIGLLTINALVAADKLIIPVQSEYLALEGLCLMLETLDRIKEGFDSHLSNVYILITMYDSRLKLSKAVEKELREKIVGNSELIICNTVIPRNVRLAEAPSHGLPIMLFDPASSGASAYIELAKEVLKNEEANTGKRIGITSPQKEELPRRDSNFID